MDRRRRPIGFTTTLGASLALLLTLLLAVPAAWAYLPQGNAVSDPTALLRNALPIDQGDLQKLQHRLEDTSDDLRAKRWTSLTGFVRRAESQLGSSRERILASFEPADRATAEALLSDAATHLQDLAAAGEAQDRDGFLAARREALAAIGRAEGLLVGEFPFAIPPEFDALPRLLGRASVRLTTTKGDLITVVDGYNAPSPPAPLSIWSSAASTTACPSTVPKTFTCCRPVIPPAH